MSSILAKGNVVQHVLYKGFSDICYPVRFRLRSAQPGLVLVFELQQCHISGLFPT